MGSVTRLKDISKMSCQIMKYSVVCGTVLFSVVSALYQPRPLPFQYGPTHGALGGAGGHGGGVDPLTLLLLQKDGGKGGIKSLLPLFLMSGGLGGGKKGGMNPLLLTSLLGDDECEEKYSGRCTQPTTANANSGFNCGLSSSYCPCCTCPDTVEEGFV